jgi:hypothetical protein
MPISVRSRRKPVRYVSRMSKSVRRTSARGKSVRRKSVRRKSVRRKSVRRKSVRRKSSRGKSSRGKSSRRKSARRKSARGKSVRGKSARGKSIRRKSARRKSLRKSRRKSLRKAAFGIGRNSKDRSPPARDEVLPRQRSRSRPVKSRSRRRSSVVKSKSVARVRNPVLKPRTMLISQTGADMFTEQVSDGKLIIAGKSYNLPSFKLDTGTFNMSDISHPGTNTHISLLYLAWRYSDIACFPLQEQAKMFHIIELEIDYNNGKITRNHDDQEEYESLEASVKECARGMETDQINFIVVFLNIKIEDGNEHQNVLIYSKKANTIYRFEPYGGGELDAVQPLWEETWPMLNRNETVKKEALNLFEGVKEILKMKKISYEMITPSCRLQTTQEKEQIWSVFDSKSAEGFCAGWSMWFTEYVLANPDKSMSQLELSTQGMFKLEGMTPYIGAYSKYLGDIKDKIYADGVVRKKDSSTGKIVTYMSGVRSARALEKSTGMRDSKSRTALQSQMDSYRADKDTSKYMIESPFEMDDSQGRKPNKPSKVSLQVV